jgi:hypothetical protein
LETFGRHVLKKNRRRQIDLKDFLGITFNFPKIVLDTKFLKEITIK